MAISQQLIVVATLVTIFTGFANADHRRCPRGFKDCDNDMLINGCETAITNDSNNCGNCGVVCPASPNPYPDSLIAPTCSKSKCGFKCLGPDWVDCNGVFNEMDPCETNIRSDPRNCGRCGRKCPTPDPKFAYATCNNGKCGIQCRLKSPKQHCNKDWAKTGCDVDLLNDNENCGSCGNHCWPEWPQSFCRVKGKCNFIAQCVKGKCTYVCLDGYDNCKGNFKKNGCDTHVERDPNNCGECGMKCPPPRKFIGGESICREDNCSERCKAGTKFNGKRCVNN